MKLRKIAIVLAAVLLASPCFAADNQDGGSSAAEGPGKFRLPVIKTPADVEGLTHLNAEEKALALENLRKVPPTDGWLILASDPDTQAFWQLWERELTALLYPDMQAVPFSPMNLITLEVARHSGNDYLIGILRQVTAVSIADYDKPHSYYTKLALLEYPDSEVWTDEERMTLKFTRACLENTMTDELFEQARKAWGDQMILRYISWVGYVNQWAILENVLGMRFEPATMNFPKGAMSPAVIDAITKKIEPTKQEFRNFWRTQFEFEFHAPPGSDKDDHK